MKLLPKLQNAALPVRFTPNATAGSYAAAARLENIGWYLVVSSAKEIDAAHTRARHNWISFLQLFLAGAGAATVAGLCVVALVWHTERLARQRSQFAASAAHEFAYTARGSAHVQRDAREDLGDPARSKDYAHRVTEEARDSAALSPMSLASRASNTVPSTSVPCRRSGDLRTRLRRASACRVGSRWRSQSNFSFRPFAEVAVRP